MLLDQNRYELATKSLTTALSIHPEHSEAFGLLSYAYNRMGQLDKGLECAKNSLKVDPFNRHAHYTICEISVRKDRYGSFIKKLKNAQQVVPHDPHFFYLDAFYYFSKGKWQEALAKAKIGLRLAPTSQNLLNVHARSLINLKDKKAAQASLDYALRLNPWSFESLESKGQLALEAEDWTSAERFFKDALRKNPNSKAAREGLINVIKSKIPFYKYLIKWELWSKRNQKIFMGISVGSIILLLPNVLLLEKYEDTVYENYLLVAGLIIMSPLLVMGLLGIMIRLSDIFILKKPEGANLLSDQAKKNAKGCLWVGLFLIVYFIFMLFILFQR